MTSTWVPMLGVTSTRKWHPLEYPCWDHHCRKKWPPLEYPCWDHQYKKMTSTEYPCWGSPVQENDLHSSTTIINGGVYILVVERPSGYVEEQQLKMFEKSFHLFLGFFLSQYLQQELHIFSIFFLQFINCKGSLSRIRERNGWCWYPLYLIYIYTTHTHTHEYICLSTYIHTYIIDVESSVSLMLIAWWFQ